MRRLGRHRLLRVHFYSHHSYSTPSSSPTYEQGPRQRIQAYISYARYAQVLQRKDEELVALTGEAAELRERGKALQDSLASAQQRCAALEQDGQVRERHRYGCQAPGGRRAELRERDKGQAQGRQQS